MDQKVSYSSLVQEGLKLSEADLQTVVGTILQGAEEVKEYLQIDDAEWPKFTISDTVTVLGYSFQNDTIGFSLRHLNHIAIAATPLSYKDQLVCFVPNKFYIIIKYLSWLKALGRESSIHRYQKLGNNSKLKIRFPDPFPKISPNTLLLSDLEVEARNISDQIADSKEEIPLWKNLDEYFSQAYPAYYNKPLSALITLPKPEMSISFELESFGI